MLVAFHLPRRPLSASAKLSQGYVRAIAEAARGAYTGPTVAGPLYSRIIWFHKYRSTQGDTDNIIKKIHDSLIGIIFHDDQVITRTMAVRVDASEKPEIVPDPLNPLAAATVAESLSEPDFKDVLYIEVGLQQTSKVQLGPIS